MESLEISDLLINDFLTQLEYLALKKEEKIDALVKENEDYSYIQSLIEVLERSKIAFVEGYFAQTPEKQGVFKEIVNKIIIDSNQQKRLFEEINNLFYLKEYNLDKQEEALEQKQTSEHFLSYFSEKLKSFLNSINYSKNQELINESKIFIEKIIVLATSFEEKEVISDIDFFQEIIEKIDLTENEKRNIIRYALINNLESYKQNKKASSKNIEIIPEKENTSSEQNKTFQSVLEPSQEKIDILLSEMLNEDDYIKDSRAFYK